MAVTTENLLAIPDKRAARLARITMRQLRYWEQIGLVTPSIKRQLSPRNAVRLYGFQDLIELLVAAELRHRPGISLQHIQRVIAYLHSSGFETPLSELRFATHGSDIYVQYPDGTWSGDPVPDQVVFHQVITLDFLRERVEAIQHRDPDVAGTVVTLRGVLGSKPIFAGTRIPVAAVQRYLSAGYSDADIIEEYPSLTPADIQTAEKYALDVAMPEHAPRRPARARSHPAPGAATG